MYLKTDFFFVVRVHGVLFLNFIYCYTTIYNVSNLKKVWTLF